MPPQATTPVRPLPDFLGGLGVCQSDPTEFIKLLTPQADKTSLLTRHLVEAYDADLLFGRAEHRKVLKILCALLAARPEVLHTPTYTQATRRIASSLVSIEPKSPTCPLKFQKLHTTLFLSLTVGSASGLRRTRAARAQYRRCVRIDNALARLLGRHTVVNKNKFSTHAPLLWVAQELLTHPLYPAILRRQKATSPTRAFFVNTAQALGLPTA